MKRLVWCLATLTVSACSVSLDTPAGVTIYCPSNGECPAGLVCVQDTNTCVSPGTSCVEKSGDVYVPAADGNICELDGKSGVCRSGACIRCGDGVIDVGETCDDGNLDDSDDCPSNCLTARCGDGYTRSADEECDDGNTDNTDTCINACKLNGCGDGFIDAEREECDDGNGNENDACSSCKATRWTSTIAFGLGPDQGAPLATGFDDLSVIACDAQGRVYSGWGRVTTVIPDTATNDNDRTFTTGGVISFSPTANIWLDVSARTGAAGDYDFDEVSMARAVQLGLVTGVTTDTRGNLYVAMVNYTVSDGVSVAYGAYVLAIDATGVMSIVAGGNSQCVSSASDGCGDGGRARDARFDYPTRLAFDRRGQLNIVDNRRVRVIDEDSNISAVAGARVGSCDSTQPCGDGEDARDATFIGPLAIAFDSGNAMYITDAGAHRSRFIDPSTGSISTSLGNGTACSNFPTCPGSAALAAPIAIAIDASDKVYIADVNPSGLGGDVVRYHDLSMGAVSIVLGTGTACKTQPCGDDGPGATAETGFLRDLTLANDGRLLVVETVGVDATASPMPTRVRVVDPTTGTVSAYAGRAGAGAPVTGNLGTSHGAGNGPIAWTDTGDIVFADDSRVFSWSATNKTVSFIGGSPPSCIGDEETCPRSGDAATFRFGKIAAVRSVGDVVYVSDNGLDHVFAIANGSVTAIFASDTPCGLPVCADQSDPTLVQVKSVDGIEVGSGHLYVTDTVGQTVWDVTLPSGPAQRIAGNGTTGSASEGATATSAPLSCPLDVTVASDGAVMIADTDNCAIRRVSAGVITTVTKDASCPSSATCGAWATSADAVFIPRSLTNDGTDVFVGSDAHIYRLQGATRLPVGGVTPLGDTSLLNEGFAATASTLPLPRLASHPTYGNIVSHVFNDARLIRKITSDGTVHTLVGKIDGALTGDFGVAEIRSASQATELDATHGLIVDQASAIVRRVDFANQTVEAAIFAVGGAKIDSDTSLARYATASGTLGGVAVDEDNAIIYLSDLSSRVFSIDAHGASDPTQWTVHSLGKISIKGLGSIHSNALAYAKTTGKLLAVDSSANAVYAITVTGAAQPEVVAGIPPFAGSSGDGGPATNALLDSPADIVVAPSGSIYIADSGNNRVRRIQPDGTIDTVLGTGVASSDGASGVASALPMNAPRALAMDQYGNLLVANGPVVRAVYASSDGTEPNGASDASTIYDARTVSTQADIIRCLSAVFNGGDGEIFVADGCAGIVLRLQRD